MTGYAPSIVKPSYQSLTLPKVLGIGVLATASAIYDGNAKAQEAVNSPEVYATMKAGFPDNFDDLVANKTVMLFKNLVPVLVNNETKITSSSHFDAETFTNRNQQWSIMTYSMQGNRGSAYQIKEANGKVVATALIPSEVGLEQIIFNIRQDGPNKMIMDVTSPTLDAANLGGGGGGGGGGGAS